MKKMISASGFGALAIALLMSSCVSKKKYVQAQQTIEKYRMDSTQMAQTAAGLQQNITSLEEKNRTMQSQWDSSKSAAQSEIQRWSGLQGYYDEQRTNVTNIHEQLHTALAESDVIKADEITASNGRVYVTLDDQVFSGGQLSSKGRKAIADFAGVLKDKQDLVVDVASGNSYAAYWNNGSTASGSTMGSTDAASASSTTGSTGNNATASTDDDDDATTGTVSSSSSSSSRPTAKTATASRSGSATVRRSSTATRSTRATATRSTARKSTARRTESGRSMSFKSRNTSSKTNSSWNSNIAKATAIAKELHKNGVYNVGLMVPGSANSTDAGTTTGKNNFQLIVSPKGDRYYQMIESSRPAGTNGTQATGTGTGTGTGSGGGQ